MQKVIFPVFFLLLFLMPAQQLPAIADTTNKQLAAQYFREGEYEKALALYEELFRHSPTTVIYNNYLQSLLALEEYSRAESLVRTQMRVHPGDVRYELDLGWVFHRAGNSRQERRHFDRLIGRLEAGAEAVVDLALAFEHRGFADRALETYHRGRELLGDSHPLHLRIAALYDRTGNHRAMMEEYLDYMVEHPNEMQRVRGLLQDAIANDPGFSRNDALRRVLLVRTQQHPGNILWAEMLLWLSLQQQDFRMAFLQARAIDRRLRQEGDMVLEVARLSTSNQDYEVAAQAYSYLLEMGSESTHYLDALVGYLNVRYLSVINEYTYSMDELAAIEQEYLEAIATLGARVSTVPLIRNLAQLQAFYLGKTAEATQLLESTLDIPNVSERVKAECRVALADILVLTGEVWDATLLYAQVDRMFRDDPLAHEARFKNARLNYYMGEFDWARAQLDVLKAGTSRLIANDAIQLSLRIQDNVGPDGNTAPLLLFARAEKRVFMNRFDEALSLLDTIARQYPGHPIGDDVLFARAGIMKQLGNYHAADSLLARFAVSYPGSILADLALFLRAGLQHQLFGNHDMAMALYQELMLDYPGSIYALTARNRFRALRGDMVN